MYINYKQKKMPIKRSILYQRYQREKGEWECLWESEIVWERVVGRRETIVNALGQPRRKGDQAGRVTLHTANSLVIKLVKLHTHTENYKHTHTRSRTLTIVIKQLWMIEYGPSPSLMSLVHFGLSVLYSTKCVVVCAFVEYILVAEGPLQ